MNLTLNQLEKLVNDYQHDNHDGYVSNTKDWIENWIDVNINPNFDCSLLPAEPIRLADESREHYFARYNSWVAKYNSLTPNGWYKLDYLIYEIPMYLLF